MDMVSGLLSIFSGGATGLIGVVLGKAFDAWNKKQELDQLRAQWEHEAVMKDKDAAIMAQEWAARSKIAVTEGEAAKDVAASASFTESLKDQAVRYVEGMEAPQGGKVAGFVKALGWFMMVCLDFVRASIRPGMSIYLCYIATALYYDSHRAIAGADPHALSTMLEQVYVQIVYTLLYLFTTCVTWYFGVRNSNQKPPQLG